tara:strand:+ start:23207 stop:23548 length:342 start_codon:yes stop_codon:yes gene_type:complete
LACNLCSNHDNHKSNDSPYAEQRKRQVLETEKKELDVLYAQQALQKHRAECEKEDLKEQLDREKAKLQSLEVTEKAAEKKRSTIAKELEQARADPPRLKRVKREPESSPERSN